MVCTEDDGIRKKRAQREGGLEDHLPSPVAGRFRRAGRAGRPAAPLPNRRIKTGGPYKYGAPYFRDGRVARRERASQRRLAPGEARPDLWKRCGRDGGRAVSETDEAKRVRGQTACDFPRTQVCDESRGVIGVVARVGFSDVAKGDEGKTTGRSSSTPAVAALPHLRRSVLPHGYATISLQSEEKMCGRERPHACGGAEAVCKVGEGGETATMKRYKSSISLYLVSKALYLQMSFLLSLLKGIGCYPISSVLSNGHIIIQFRADRPFPFFHFWLQKRGE